MGTRSPLGMLVATTLLGLKLAGMICLLVLVALAQTIWDGRTADERHDQQLMKHEMQIGHINDRVTNIEAQKVPETLATMKATLEFDHQVLIFLAITVFAMALETIWRNLPKMGEVGERRRHGQRE